jgi:hypothetical protein
MIAFGLVCVGVFLVQGLYHAKRIGVVSAAAAGAFLSWLVGAIREAPLLRQLGLYCPQCGAALVEASEDRVPLQLIGWKERPSPRPGDSATDPLGIVIAPPDDPGFAVGTQVLVLMQRVYGTVAWAILRRRGNRPG